MRHRAAIVAAALGVIAGGACNLVAGLDSIQIAGCVADTDCDADHYCAVATHTCVLQLTPGSGPCLADDECTTSACGINGVCCAAPCTTADDACGATGCAGGDGACVYAPTSTVCSSTCLEGKLETTSCDGAGTCGVVKIVACPDSLSCGSATRCATACGADAGACIAGYYCDTTCTPLLSSGAVCTMAQQCASQVCNCDSCGACVCM